MRPVTLRPAEPEDDAFLDHVYASTRIEELAPLGLGEAQLTAFLKMQATMQRRSWEASFPRLDRAVVLVGGAPAGRLYVDRSGAAIRLVDIALLPEHRGAGLGERILRDLVAEADAAGKPVLLHVERYNRARRLYDRLGFVATEEGDIHCAMERAPARAALTA